MKKIWGYKIIETNILVANDFHDMRVGGKMIIQFDQAITKWYVKNRFNRSNLFDLYPIMCNCPLNYKWASWYQTWTNILSDDDYSKNIGYIV